MLLETIKFIVALLTIIILVLMIWNGYRLEIGSNFSVEQYPLKRFFKSK